MSLRIGRREDPVLSVAVRAGGGLKDTCRNRLEGAGKPEALETASAAPKRRSTGETIG